MDFSILAFSAYLTCVAFCYLLIPHAVRRWYVVGAALLFYGYLFPFYIPVLVISIFFNYVLGIALENGSRRLLYLWCGILVNVGCLAFFKYGQSLPITDAYFIVVPAGLAFYTLQEIGYLCDVYTGRIPAERNLSRFGAFVAFLPQLLAGPIERAAHMLPQFESRHTFESERVAEGLRLIMWGLFKKVAVADLLALIVATSYKEYTHVSGVSLLIGTYLYAFQLYYDFSGYTDIARGAAKIMGFSLMENFRFPYSATSIPDFWRRWHISLSSWFRDYVYIPLGGNRFGFVQQSIAIVVVFFLSGLWHGDRWTFVAWGLLHGLYMLYSVLGKNLRERAAVFTELASFPVLRRYVQIFTTFHLVAASWILFLTPSVFQAEYIVKKIVYDTIHFVLTPHLTLKSFLLKDLFGIKSFLIVALILILFTECTERWMEYSSVRSRFLSLPVWVRWLCYYAIILCIFLGAHHTSPFIYATF